MGRSTKGRTHPAHGITRQSFPAAVEDSYVSIIAARPAIAGELATLISALFYDLVQDKAVQIPKQGERRERELQEVVKKGKRPVALFVNEAHDLNGHTIKASVHSFRCR